MGFALRSWLPGVLYLAAALLDGVDGALSRRTGMQTPLGKTLDVNIDALGVLVTSVVAVTNHRLPAYYLAAAAAYYLYHFGLWRWRRRGKQVHPTGSRTFARLVAGFQMGFLGTALLPIFTYNVLKTVAPLFLLPLLAGFFWDWAMVRGRISDHWARHCQAMLVTFAAKGPPILRGGVLVLGGLLLPASPGSTMSGEWLAGIGLGLMVVTGFLGRTAALLLSLMLAYKASVSAVSSLLMTTLASTVLIMMTGTGDRSLWRPEDTFLLRPPGTLWRS